MIASWTRVVAVKMETSGLFKVKMTGSHIGLNVVSDGEGMLKMTSLELKLNLVQ